MAKEDSPEQKLREENVKTQQLKEFTEDSTGQLMTTNTGLKVNRRPEFA